MRVLESASGLSELAPPRPSQVVATLPSSCQHTLKTAIDCAGVALHSGRPARLTLRPAPAGTGIVFRRTDLRSPRDIPRDISARFDAVADTTLSTVLAHPQDPAHRVGTVEHVLAALAGAGVDNAVLEVDGPEVPILDGSAASFQFLIDCAGIARLDSPAAEIEVLRPVRVQDGPAWAELRPAAAGFDLAVSIAFEAEAIGSQSFRLLLSPTGFRTHLARARTFALAGDIERLRRAGLARGGSLGNAIVVDGPIVLNPAGLHWPDEFVRHKMLDVVGDLSLAGAPIRGRFVGHRCGHALNNRLLRALFADAANWRRLEAGEAGRATRRRREPVPAEQRIAA